MGTLKYNNEQRRLLPTGLKLNFTLYTTIGGNGHKLSDKVFASYYTDITINIYYIL